METSANGIHLIEQFEGCRLRAYQDAVGVWTIGYGHTRGVFEGMTTDHDGAEALLRMDLEEAEAAVNRLVAVPIEQCQFDALVSFTFNLGAGNLSRSTLLRKLNDGDYEGAAAEFPRWNRAGEKVLAGLTRRREAEQALFRGGA